MKTLSKFKTKLLFYWARNPATGGLTLVELMIAMIFISLLSAMALPNLIRQAGKAREVEFKNTIGVINRAQQTYHWEKGFFVQGDDDAESISMLNLSFNNKYIQDYNIVAYDEYATVTPTNPDYIQYQTRAYSGGTYYTDGEYTVIICQSDELAPSMGEPVSDSDCGPDAARIR